MQPEKLLKDYVASIEVPNSVKPDAVRDMLLRDNELTAGTFLKSLRQLKISGSEFLDLLGNSRIGNSEYRYIEENPHLRFDELLAVLDNSVLTSEDYRVLLAAATHRKKLRDERRRREEEAVARLERDRAMAQKTAAEAEPVEEVPTEETPVEEIPAEEIPVEEVPTEATPTEEVPAEELPTEEITAEETPTEEVPVEELPAEEIPVEEVPAEETPVEEVPVEETPNEENPAPTDIISEISDMFAGAPAVEGEPAEEIPAEITSAEETPAEEVPVEELPAEETPTEETPTEEAPIEEVPTEEIPAEETPAEKALAEITPAGAISVEEAIAEKTLALTDIISEVNNMLVGAPAVEEVPAEAAPAGEKTAETAPAEVAPAKELPAEAAPADEKTAEAAPAEETPTEKVSDTQEVQAPAEQSRPEEAHEEQASVKDTPAKDASEDSEEDWEYEVYENDSLYDDDDYSAKSLARSVGELVEKREGRAKNCLIAAFSLAAAVLVFGVGFKLLKFYQVLPTYTYEIPAAPEEFSQQITNDKELLECARTPDEAVSYLSAAESPARAEHTYEQSKTAFSPKYVLRVCDNGKGKLVIKGGSINDKGKVESKFTADVFDDDITDLNIFYKEYDGKGYFILTAPAGDETCVKIYEQDALRQLDAPTVDYRQSGAMLDYYIGEDAFYPISYVEFDVDKANSGKPETFVPHIYNNDRSRAAAFNDIVLPYAAARLNYYVVSRLPFNGGNDCFVKASAVGENSGWAISAAGLYTSDTVKVNGDTHTRLTRICFDNSLTPSQYDLDGAVYPEMIAAGETKLAVLGKGAENTSVLYVLPAALSSEPSAVDDIAENKPTADIFCEGDILSVITAEEKPMQYSFDLNTLKSCEPIDNSLIFIKDGLYAKTEVKDKGVTLSVCIDKNTALASVEISEDGGTNYRLPSNSDAVVTGISGDNVIIGVPVVYYDGVTDVGKFQFYTYKDKKLSPLGEIIVMEGDLSFITGAVTDGGYIVTVWGSRVITADSAKLKIISDASL